MSFTTLEEMIVAAAEAVRPPERLSVSEGAAKYRYLNNAGSYVGLWKNRTTPYLVEPMDTLGSLDHTGLIFVGPARTGKSDMFFNWLTTTAMCDPADMIIYLMTQNTARDWSQGDLAKAFRAKPPGEPAPLGSRLVPGRQNDNVHDKKFLSGMRLLVKWPTITELSGKTIPRLWLADYDRMPQDVEGEGNPFDLARKRATTFKRFGMCVAESSPGFMVENPKWIAGSPHEAPPTDGILKLYNRGDRRRWRWRCPQCQESFEPRFSLLSYPDSADRMEAAEQAVLVCPHDGFPMTPDMKNDLNEQGRWVKEGQVWMPDGSMAGKPRRSDIASFWMFGPAAAFQDWKGLVLNHLNASDDFEATGSEDSLKTTVTVDQGEAYSPKAMQSDRLPEELKARARDWGGTAAEPVVPDGVRFLVATIDVQAGGRPSFVVHVHGYGVGGDVWIVDTFKIRKSDRIDENDPRGDYHLLDPASYPEDWHLLIPQVIEKTYPLADGSGRKMQIKAIGCDSGGREGVTTNAYGFWRYLRDEHDGGHHRRFHLIKGEASKSAPRVHVTYPDSSRRDRNAGARGDIPVLLINSNQMKDQVAAKLGRTDAGGGMVNFNSWAEDWLYTQLTAEIRTAKGWENPSKRRNEAFDLLYYAEAICLLPAIRIEQLDWDAPPGWADEWEANDLVSAAEAEARFQQTKKPTRSLADLAESLG